MTAKRGKSSLQKQVDRAETTDAADRAEEQREALKQALQDKYEDIKNERLPDRLQRLIDALREAEHLARDKDQD